MGVTSSLGGGGGPSWDTGLLPSRPPGSGPTRRLRPKPSTPRTLGCIFSEQMASNRRPKRQCWGGNASAPFDTNRGWTLRAKRLPAESKVTGGFSGAQGGRPSPRVWFGVDRGRGDVEFGARALSGLTGVLAHITTGCQGVTLHGDCASTLLCTLFKRE